MPLELILEAPKTIGCRSYEERQPTGSEVLVETLVSGIKSGTEINLYRGTAPFVTQVWDTQLRLFRPPLAGEPVPAFYPHTLGSWAAGRVAALGPEALRFKVGDLVHGDWKHRQTAVLAETALYPVAAPSLLETMLFTDPAKFALAGIHDAGIKLGERVAIFGLGAIGLLAVQMARLSGAAQVIVVDPITARRKLARKFGADDLIDPAEVDSGQVIKQCTGGLGADVTLEVSGSYAALQHAIRGARQGGRVVTASYYSLQAGALDLSREWHHNRITLISSMPVWDCPHRDYPLWDLARLESMAVELLAAGRLDVAPMIGERIPFERATEAYRLIDTTPDERVKFVLTYGGRGVSPGTPPDGMG